MARLPRARRMAVTATLGCASSAMMLMAATLGLRTPPEANVRSFAAPAAVDYSRARSTFQRLRAPFLSAALGDLPAPPGETNVRSAFPFLAHRRGGVLPRLDVTVAALSNDTFARAFEVKSIPFTGREETVGASREAGVPNGCGNSGAVWYRFTPDRDSRLTANTFDSDYPTYLAVYRGDSLRNLRQLECQQDGRGETQVVFQATAGVRYYFGIAPLTGSGGHLVFHLEKMGELEPAVYGLGGLKPDGDTAAMGISFDGRSLAVWSWADDLSPGYSAANCVPDSFINDYAGALGNPSCGQIYVRDRWRNSNVLASVSGTGAAGDDASALPVISGDGRVATYASMSDNLTGHDPNDVADLFDTQGVWRVFLRDLQERRTSLGSTSAGLPADGWAPHLSYDGRYVAFTSGTRIDGAHRIQSDPQNLYTVLNSQGHENWDSYVLDRVTGRTRLASVGSSGQQGNYDGGGPEADYAPSISADGRFVEFASDASNLVPGDTNHATDVFVHDFLTGRTTRVSVASDGSEADGRSILFVPGPTMSADGRYVVFGSYAANLIPAAMRPAGASKAVPPGLGIYLHDTLTGTTTAMSLAPLGGPQVPSETFGGGSNLQDSAAISGDGRYVVFSSRARPLGPKDPAQPQYSNVFVRDLYRGTIDRISVNPRTGEDPNGDCGYVTISGDGRFVVFNSQATDLIGGWPGFSKFDSAASAPMFAVIYRMPELR